MERDEIMDTIGFGSYLKDYLEFNNISQTEFAERLDITPKHLNEILNKNIDFSNELLIAISLITDIDVNFILKIEHLKKMKQKLLKEFKSEKELKEYLKKYEINELEQKGWIIFKNKNDSFQNAIDILNFMKFKDFDAVTKYENNILYKKKGDNVFKLLLWISKCDELAIVQKVSKYDKNNFNKLLNYLKEERMKEINITDMTKTFNEYGYYFVVNESLKSTKVRGCLKVKGNNPAIYLTKMYKDKASFYFALYHELGHSKSDYNMAKNKIMVDGNDLSEEKADKFALEQMINSDIWNEIKKDFSEKNLLNISKNNNIPMCFIISRLAFEKIIQYNNPLYLKYKETL